MNTKILHRLALVITLATFGGCGFRTYLRDARDPALAVQAPCYSGDICATSAPFAWAPEVMRSAGR